MTKILNKRSAVLDKMPTPDQLEYGELAVNYNANGPFISIKDSNDQVVKLGSGGGSSETPITIKQKYESNPDTNAFTDAEKTKLSGIDPTTYATQTDLDGKVDKIAGKGLSTNDYTTTEKNKLSGVATGAQVNVLEGVQVNGTDLSITGKKVNVDLSTYATTSAMTTALDNKVDKVSGKDLSTNDYTTEEKTKLTNLESYVSDLKFYQDGTGRVGVQYTNPVTGDTERIYSSLSSTTKLWDLHSILETPSEALQMYEWGRNGDVVKLQEEIATIVGICPFSNSYHTWREFYCLAQQGIQRVRILSTGEVFRLFYELLPGNLPIVAIDKGGTGASTISAACRNLNVYGFYPPKDMYPDRNLNTVHIGAWYVDATTTLDYAPVKGVPYRVHTYEIDADTIIQEVHHANGTYTRSRVNGEWGRWRTPAYDR